MLRERIGSTGRRFPFPFIFFWYFVTRVNLNFAYAGDSNREQELGFCQMETLPSLNPSIAPVIGPGAVLTSKLESVRRVIDEKFLATCELLSQSIDGIENLIASLDMLAETLDAKVVAATTEDLQMAANKLFALPASHSERIVKISRLSKCREEFSERVSDMRCSFAYMRAMVSGVDKYYSAQDDAARDAVLTPKFNAYLADVASYIEQGTNELKKLEFDLSSLQLGLESVLAQGEILEFQIDQLLPMVPDDLTSNANTMGNHYLRVVSTAGSVSALARDIHLRVSRLLGALQIGDITRQRVEHIQAGVILIDTGAKLLSPDRRERIVNTLYALLAAQISAASADFQREVSEIGQSMAGLAADARELLRLHDMAYGAGDAKGGFLRRISDQIERASELVSEVEKAEQTAIDTVNDSVTSAEELNERVEILKTLKSAFPKADPDSLLSEEALQDDTLKSIVLELNQYGEHLASAVDACVTISETLAKTAKSAVHDWQTDARKESEGAAAAAALTVAMERVHRVRDKTEVDIAATVAKGDTVLNMLEISAGRIDFHTGVGEIVQEVTRELTELGEQASPYQDEDTALLETVLTRMAKFYSMSQEREIHRSFVAALGAGAQEPDPSQFDKDDFETILF